MASIRRVNTVNAQFENDAPRPTAMEIHIWIQQTLDLNTEKFEMLQLNAQKRAICIKVISPVYMKNW